MAKSFGAIVAEARRSEGISLRELGLRLGISITYCHDIERDRRPCPVARWADLVAALPSLTLDALADAAIGSGTVEIDVSELTPEQRAMVAAALVQQATAAHRVAA